MQLFLYKCVSFLNRLYFIFASKLFLVFLLFLCVHILHEVILRAINRFSKLLSVHSFSYQKVWSVAVIILETVFLRGNFRSPVSKQNHVVSYLITFSIKFWISSGPNHHVWSNMMFHVHLVFFTCVRQYSYFNPGN